MKILSLIFAVLAIACVAAEGWLGPLYTMYDWCECHRSRAWLEFDDCSNLRGVEFFLRIEQVGDARHQHQFCDPKYEGQYPVFMYGGAAFGMASVASAIRGRK